MLLRELHIGHVQDAFQRLFDDGMTAVTARRLFSTLRSALNAAVRERLISDNPARYLKLPKGRRPFAVVWTRRRGEACGLRWDDLDLDEGIVYISRQLQQGRTATCADAILFLL